MYVSIYQIWKSGNGSMDVETWKGLYNRINATNEYMAVMMGDTTGAQKRCETDL